MAKVLVVLGAVFALVAGGVFWALSGLRQGTSQIPYTATTVRLGTVTDALSESGTLMADQTTPVTAGVSGQVSVPVALAVGQSVVAGETLAVVSNPQLLQAVATDQRNVAQAQWNLRLAEASTAVASSQLTLQDDQSAVLAAQRALSTARLAWQQQQQTVAALQGQEQALTVDSPRAGVVVNLAALPGQNVGSGASLATIASSNALQLNLLVPEGELPDLSVGQPLTVTAAGVVAPGQITAVGVDAQPGHGGTVDLPVTGAVQWVHGLAPGLTVGVEVGAVSPTGGLAPPAYGTTGTLSYLERVVVSAAVGGQVASVPVQTNSPIAAGQVLLTLQDPALQAQWSQAQQSLVQDGETISADQTAVQRAEQKLALDQAAAHVAGLQATASVASAQSQLAVQEATLASDQALVQELTVKAPVTGRLASWNVAPGAEVGAQQVLCQIVDPNRLNLLVQVPQSGIDEIHLGQSATVTTDAVAGKSFPATVAAVSPVGVDTNGIADFAVTLSLEETAGLLPGMAADASIPLRVAKDVPLIPLEAVHGLGFGGAQSTTAKSGAKSGGGPWVMVVRPTGAFAKVHVQLGVSDGLEVQLSSGVAAGQRVVTSSLADLPTQTKLSLLGRVFHHQAQRTAGATLRRGGAAGARATGRAAPVRRALPARKG